MNVDFYEKRLQQYRSYFQVSSKTHSHTFYQILGKIVGADLEKIGNSPKIPCQISRERFELRQPNSVIWSRTSIPTCVIFFRIFRQGVGERGRFQFSKKIGVGQTAKQLQGPLHNKVEMFLRNSLEKRHENAIMEPEFSFSIQGCSAAHPKLPHFWGNFGFKPLDKR